MEKEIKNILIICSQNINKDKYYFSLLKLKNLIYEKSFYDENSILAYKFIYDNTIYHLNISIISILHISSKIEFDAKIEIYDSFDTLEFIDNFQECFHKEFGQKNFPSVRINLNKEIKNESIYPILNIENEKINEIKWEEIFKKLIDEIKKEEKDEFPYNHLLYNKNKNINNYDKNDKIEIRKNNCNYWIIFTLIIIFGLLDFYVLIFISEYNNIKYNYDGIYANIKSYALIIFFYTIYLGITNLNIKNHKKKEKNKFKKFVLISFIIGISLLFFEIFSIVKYSYINNRNKNYLKYQVIFDIILILLFLILFSFKFPF